uniref:ATP-grasp domain-containing protein n=1 Tax=Lachnoclostridium phocaeense TaxID=1871021 RepID=UPI0026DB354A|nr:hypothetical protein [Lachnoclostridium phocaeense]
MKPIAICQNKKIFNHSTSWTPRFIEFCRENNIPFEIVDCYRSDVVKKLPNYSALLWNYSNFVIADLLEARNIIQIADNLGLETFPYPGMNWHFDDKIAEMYAFESIGAEIPRNWVFYAEDECLEWVRHKAEYPIVAKLRCGSGANNVKLLRNAQEAVRYVKRMFGKGFDPAPSLAYKAYSKIQSSKDLSMVIARIKKIPEFLNTRAHAKMMPIEKGYCYFQEYIPNDGYDLKVVVIGDKMTFCARNVRKNDFRASGGGDCYYDRTLLTNDVIDTAFDAAKRLNMDCVGFDFVVDKKSGKGKIIEMCYGFDYKVQKDLGAYVDRNHIWHEQAVIVPDEIVKIVIEKVR